MKEQHGSRKLQAAFVAGIVMLISCSYGKGQSDEESQMLGLRFPSVCKVGASAGDGVLIAPGWVLTAGHVAEGMFRRTQGEVTVRWNEHESRVKSVFLHPEFREMADEDLALLQLEQPVTGIEPAPIYQGADEGGREIVVVGHGDKRMADGRWLKDGKKRAFTNMVDRATPFYIRFDYDAPGSNASRLEWSCGPGDSGGPAFLEVAGSFFVAGISSRGEPGPEGKCSYGSEEYFVRVSSYADWIRQTMEHPDEAMSLKLAQDEIAAVPEAYKQVVDKIVNAFEHFSSEGMQQAIAETYAKSILSIRPPERIMNNMPAMMRQLPGASLRKLVSLSRQKAAAELEKEDAVYLLEFFFHPTEEGKIEQMAFGRVN